MNDTPQLPLFTIVSDDLLPIVPITNKRTKDLAGQRFGRLVALGFVGTDNGRKAKWLCKCDCGPFIVTLGESLTKGRTVSCGCFRREKTIEKNFRHGLSNSPEYITWNGIKARCENPNEAAYANYGGRGVRMCARWRHNFGKFLDDMGPKPGPEYSIERIDNNGNYEPDNCKWATRQEQNDNSRHNHLVEFQGQTRTMSQWSRLIGVNVGTLFNRLRTGWSIEDALTTSSERDSLEFQGERLTISQWAKRTGIDARTLRYRVARGWPIEKVLTFAKYQYYHR